MMLSISDYHSRRMCLGIHILTRGQICLDHLSRCWTQKEDKGCVAQLLRMKKATQTHGYVLHRSNRAKLSPESSMSCDVQGHLTTTWFQNLRKQTLEIKSIWKRYNNAKWASKRKIRDRRIFLLMLWLKR